MINSFTLSQLIEMSGDNRQGLIRECFTASSDNRMEIFRFPCRIDAFVIGVGTEGETSVSLNLHEYRLKKNSIFIFSPKNILQVKSEEYFKADVIVVSPDFLRRINIDTKNLLQLFLQFAANPCLTLTHEESHSIRSFIAQIERETGHFTFAEVCDGVCRKLIERHPHIFGGDESIKDWDSLKNKEKGRLTLADDLESVPGALPALMRAAKLQKRAARCCRRNRQGCRNGGNGAG